MVVALACLAQLNRLAFQISLVVPTCLLWVSCTGMSNGD